MPVNWKFPILFRRHGISVYATYFKVRWVRCRGHPDFLSNPSIDPALTYAKFLMAMARSIGGGIDIFKVGSTLAKIRSFDFSPSPEAMIKSFSPTTHRLSISGDRKLYIFDIQDSKLLLDAAGLYSSIFQSFSSDRSLFAASRLNGVLHICNYASGCYTSWREFRCQGVFGSFRFSPAPSSILGYVSGIL